MMHFVCRRVDESLVISMMLQRFGSFMVSLPQRVNLPRRGHLFLCLAFLMTLVTLPAPPTQERLLLFLGFLSWAWLSFAAYDIPISATDLK
jgi:hypothetical protein